MLPHGPEAVVADRSTEAEVNDFQDCWQLEMVTDGRRKQRRPEMECDEEKQQEMSERENGVVV